MEKKIILTVFTDPMMGLSYESEEAIGVRTILIWQLFGYDEFVRAIFRITGGAKGRFSGSQKELF